MRIAFLALMATILAGHAVAAPKIKVDPSDAYSLSKSASITYADRVNRMDPRPGVAALQCLGTPTHRLVATVSKEAGKPPGYALSIDVVGSFLEGGFDDMRLQDGSRLQAAPMRSSGLMDCRGEACRYHATLLFVLSAADVAKIASDGLDATAILSGACSQAVTIPAQDMRDLQTWAAGAR